MINSILPVGEVIATSADFWPSRPGAVYALVAASDPDRVRYIGSSQDPISRLAAHLMSPSSKVMREWVAQMRAKGDAILMRVLARDSDRALLYAIESDQLDHYRSLGMADLNGLHTRPGYDMAGRKAARV